MKTENDSTMNNAERREPSPQPPTANDTPPVHERSVKVATGGMYSPQKSSDYEEPFYIVHILRRGELDYEGPSPFLVVVRWATEVGSLDHIVNKGCSSLAEVEQTVREFMPTETSTTRMFITGPKPEIDALGSRMGLKDANCD